MNNTENDFVMAFDHFYTTNHIQILKSLIPFLGSNLAAMLPVFVKYLELKHAISLMNQKEVMRTPDMYHCSQITSLDKITPELVENLYKSVHCYLTPEEDKKVQGIRNLMQTFASFQEMQQMMELMKVLSPDDEPIDIMSMLNNLNL